MQHHLCNIFPQNDYSESCNKEPIDISRMIGTLQDKKPLLFKNVCVMKIKNGGETCFT